MFVKAPDQPTFGRTAGHIAVALGLVRSFLLLEDDDYVDWEVDLDERAERLPASTRAFRHAPEGLNSPGGRPLPSRLGHAPAQPGEPETQPASPPAPLHAQRPAWQPAWADARLAGSQPRSRPRRAPQERVAAACGEKAQPSLSCGQADRRLRRGRHWAGGRRAGQTPAPEQVCLCPIVRPLLGQECAPPPRGSRKPASMS